MFLIVIYNPSVNITDPFRKSLYSNTCKLVRWEMKSLLPSLFSLREKTRLPDLESGAYIMINNHYGNNRTEWSPIWSVIIWMIKKIRWLRSESNFSSTSIITGKIGLLSQSCHQLIITVTKFERKKQRQRKVQLFGKKFKTVEALCKGTHSNATANHVNDTYCPITWAWCVNCSVNARIGPADNQSDSRILLQLWWMW